MARAAAKGKSSNSDSNMTSGGSKRRASSSSAAAAKPAPKKKAAAKKQEGKAAAAKATSSKSSDAKGSGGGGGGGGGGQRFFLMKSEPDTFSIAQLAALPDQRSWWEGVRNYQARNIMRDQMRVGDRAFFYHSSCKVPGIVGIVEIVKEAYPDHFQWDKASDYFDASSSRENPRWLMVDVQLKETLPQMVTLEELRQEASRPNSPLKNMVLLQKSRLSVQPVTPGEWARIQELIAAKGEQE